ncbi:MAG: NAD(P)H-dependent oxidoreductase [bacterium]|nr:NAD(P)H-dependent oxidoreductase [bacterium]
MKIGIIIGSIRNGRRTESVAHWVYQAAQARAGEQEGSGGAEVTYELLDLAEFDVPLLTSSTVPGAAKRQYEDPRVTAWSEAVDACDGFIFVTPEYNHAVPGAFKNAVDSLGNEWFGKAVAFVSHGADGGVRAVENWRVSLANFSMVDVRNVVTLGQFTDFDGTEFQPVERRAGELETVLADIEAATERNLGNRK